MKRKKKSAVFAALFGVAAIQGAKKKLQVSSYNLQVSIKRL